MWPDGNLFFHYLALYNDEHLSNGIAIAQWIRLCLPSCCPGFEPQHTPSMLFPIYIVQFAYLSFGLECENNGNEQKEAGIGPFKKANVTDIYNYAKVAKLRQICSD